MKIYDYVATPTYGCDGCNKSRKVVKRLRFNDVGDNVFMCEECYRKLVNAVQEFGKGGNNPMNWKAEFKRDDVVEFGGEQFVVIENYGYFGAVRENCKDGAHIRLYWEYQGERCKKVKKLREVCPGCEEKMETVQNESGEVLHQECLNPNCDFFAD